MEAARAHIPVMLDRTLELLAPAISRAGAVVIDATLGMGGHSEAMLTAHPSLTLIGIDRDTDALRLAGERLASFGERVHLVHAVYEELDHALQVAGANRLDGILFDLGVSSLQLDRAERGFAYSKDAPLDMRMDRTVGITAAELLARSTEAELARLFREYGDEPLAGRYARAIVRAREDQPLTRSGMLVDILQDATPHAKKNAGHPAKRVFQALRVAVNDEMAVLARAIPRALELLNEGGRIVSLAYQSHEDRLVKRAFAAASSSSAPIDLPEVPTEHLAQYALLVRGAERASESEQATNPRSIPVRLRAAERIRVRNVR